MDIYTLIPNFNKILPKFLDKKNTFLIYGLSETPLPRGLNVWKTLSENSFSAIPLCSQELKADIKCINKIDDIGKDKKIDVAVIVTPPDKTISAVKDCLAHQITKIWLEMGSETSEAIDFCKRYYAEVIYQHSLTKEILDPEAREKYQVS